MGIIEDFASDFLRVFALTEDGVTATPSRMAEMDKYRDFVNLVGNVRVTPETPSEKVFDAYHAVFLKICSTMGLNPHGFDSIINPSFLGTVAGVVTDFVELHNRTFVESEDGISFNQEVGEIFIGRAVPLLQLANHDPHDTSNLLGIYTCSRALQARICGARGPKLIGTHDGTFHCDEALAVFMLRLTNEYRDARVVRTRDPEVLATCDVVVDVGGVYDHEARRYDHHQKGFMKTFGPKHATKLSSAGLVYFHYGLEIIRYFTRADDGSCQMIFQRLYGNFIEEIDAIDNGLDQVPGARPLYGIHTNLSSRVGYLNPPWNADISPDDQFEKAVSLTGQEFFKILVYYATVWLPARDIVSKGVASRTEHDPLGRVIVLDSYTAWSGHLSSILADIDASHTVYFVVFPDMRDKTYRVRAVNSDGFKCYRYLPEAWRGLSGEALCEIAKIDGCTFVHSNGFIGGNKTRENAIKMALAAL